MPPYFFPIIAWGIGLAVVGALCVLGRFRRGWILIGIVFWFCYIAGNDWVDLALKALQTK